MNKNWTTEESNTNFKEFRNYQTHRFPWASNAKRMEQSSYARQYSPSEERMMLAFRQAPLAISISTAIMESANAAMTSINPTVAVSPIVHPFDPVRSQHSQSVAQIYNHALKKDWYDSLGSLQFDKGIVDLNNVGHGFQYVVPRFENGKFTTAVEHLPWRYTFLDPATKDPLYRTSDNIIYAMPMSRKAGFKYVKGIEPEMSYEEFEDQFVKSGEQNLFEAEDYSYTRGKSNVNEDVIFIMRMCLEDEVSYKLVPGEKSEAKGRSLGEFRHVTAAEYKGSEYESLVDAGILKKIPETKMFLTEHISVGSLGFKRVLPIDEYSIVPMVYDSPGRPYPYGRMWYIYPLQRALNKLVMNTLLNSSILNNVKVIAEDNQIINETQWTTGSSMPGVILKWRNTMPGVSKPPQVVQPTPLSDGFLVMPQFMIKMMEYVSGIHSLQQGDAQGAPNVFSTVAALNSAASQKVKRRMNHMENSLSTVGRIMGKYYREYAPLNGYVMQENDKKEQVPLIYNEIDIARQKAGKNFKIVVKPGTDLSDGFDDVRFTVEGSSGTEAATEASMISNIIQTTGKTSLLPELLKRLNISDVNELIAKVEAEDDLSAQNAQLQKMTQELEKQNRIAQNQIKQLGISLERAKAKGTLDAGVTKVLTELKTISGESE